MSNVSTTTAAIYQAVLDSLNSSGECGVLPPAPPGKSAYEVAVANGFKGSEKQWLDSLTFKQEQEIARLEARIVGNEKFTKDSSYAASRVVGTSNGQVPLANQVSSLLGTAATKDVGTSSGQVVTWGSYGINNTGVGGKGFSGGPVHASYKTGTLFGGGLSMGTDADARETPAQIGGANSWHSIFSVIGQHGSITTQSQFYVHGRTMYFRFRYVNHEGAELEWARNDWVEIYTDKNTFKEEGTGYIYTSSPIILLRDGTMDKVHEAVDMDCELIKNSVGDYTLKNTTGLRDNEWQAVPPKDVHGNPLCMIVVTEPSEGEVSVKTYKRKFDIEKAAVVADLEQPFDIPEGASVRLHFNDLPQEELDESEQVTEVVEEEPKD